ncbi:MAG TPA: hypothetical protein GXX46_07015 [Peptococcaceae bacterium]|nr:hypothetical protein [Peptococcaceae bacterium]
MIFADLHIHIGRSLNGKAVKVTASPTLTLPEIIDYSNKVKGLNLIGIVDSHSLGVRQDYKELLREGLIKPLSSGGYKAENLVVIPGIETELRVGQGHAHFLAFFPWLDQLEAFCEQIKKYISNWQLSSQKVYLEPGEWISRVENNEGIWLPAHAFTPHKGIYGACCSRLAEVLPKLPLALEMGLSADRKMALSLSELEKIILFSNSDAHSLVNIAREYNLLELSEVSFSGLSNLVIKQEGQVIQNFGLPPQMGKYHRSYCLNCKQVSTVNPPVVCCCPFCGSEKLIIGVLDRLTQIADMPINFRQNDHRYVYRVPLQFLPGIGPKKYALLLKKFKTELTVYHQAAKEDLVAVVGEKVAEIILKARTGKLELSPGGGGYYGKVRDIV